MPHVQFNPLCDLAREQFLLSSTYRDIPRNERRDILTAKANAKVLTGGGALGEAQVDVPLSVSHSCVCPHSWAQ